MRGVLGGAGAGAVTAPTDAALVPVPDTYQRVWWVCVPCQKSFPSLAEALDHLDEPR